MRKFIMLILLALSLGLSAESVSQDKAQLVADNWFVRFCDSDLNRVSRVIQFKEDETVCFYAFIYPKGYVIVSADDEVYPVLGYSPDAPFPDKIDHPAVESWFDRLKKSIAYIKTKKLTNRSNKIIWNQITAQDFSFAKGRTKAPLIQTKWGFTEPYRLACPLDSGSLSTPGCVAIAQAQIMRYHQYPAQGNGKNSYVCPSIYPKKLLKADFVNTTYDYSKMPLALTSDSPLEEKQEVSKLLYHCGVSVFMRYTKNASAAYSIYSHDSYKNFFKYSNKIHEVNKSDYTDNEWKNLLTNDLDDNLPIAYFGESEIGGHAYICDGYDENDLFHFNWGWGGQLDGYFQLASLHPELPVTLFPEYQNAIVQIKPRQADEKYIMITSPTGLTKLRTGQNSLINWESNAGNSVKIKLNDRVIGENIPDNGQFNFTAPQEPSCFTGLKIISEQDSSVLAYPRASSNIEIYKVSVNPYNSEQLYQGENFNIMIGYLRFWFSDSRVKIDLYRNNTFLNTICDSTEHLTSSYSWLIPQNLPAGDGYRFKITAIADSSDQAFSDTTFSIIPQPALKIITPNSASCYKLNDYGFIRWRDGISDDLKIELFKGDSLAGVIDSAVSDSSFGVSDYNWQIFSDLPKSDRYRIKISSLANPSIYDFSDEFKIIGTALKGSLIGTLKADLSPYIVTDSIFITSGNTLKIESGTEIYNSGHNLLINGALQAEGTMDKPIIFSSYGSFLFTPAKEKMTKQETSLLKFCKFNWYGSKDNSKSDNFLFQLDNSNLVLSDCRINSPRILAAQNSSNVEVTNNQIFYYINGISLQNCTAVIKGNLLVSDQWNKGTALVLNNSSPYLINNTFNYTESNDTIYTGNRNLLLKNSSPVLINNIFKYNKSAFYHSQGDSIHHIFLEDKNSHPEFYNCNLTGGKNAILTADSLSFNGTYLKCNAEDPAFAADSYTLSDNSICVNSGSINFFGIEMPTKDLFGNFRFFGDVIDIGAVENNSDIEMNKVYEFTLQQNYPNPFNNRTTINFVLNKNSLTELKIYNIKGEIVYQDLINGLRGKNSFIWQADKFSSGVYLYQMKTGKQSELRRMVLIK